MSLLNDRNYIDTLCDANISLKEWKNEIDKLIKEYGKDARMGVDAGYNNVDFFIIRREKCAHSNRYKAKKPPKCGCVACLLKWHKTRVK